MGTLTGVERQPAGLQPGSKLRDGPRAVGRNVFRRLLGVALVVTGAVHAARAGGTMPGAGLDAAPAPVVARPSVPPRPLALANGIRFDGPSTAPAAGPDRLFVLHCAGCHGFDGSGHPAQGVPDMRGALGHYLRTAEGRAFIVQVPGVNNAGLDDAQIAAVTTWAVQRFSATTAPAGWVPYGAAEVAGHRAQRPVDVAARRAEVLRGLQALGVSMY